MALCVSAKPACGLLRHNVDLVPCGQPREEGTGAVRSSQLWRGQGPWLSGFCAEVWSPFPRWVSRPAPGGGNGGKESHQGHQWMSPGLSRGIALSPPWPQTLLTRRVTSLTCQSSACSWRDCGIGEAARAWLECKPCLCLGDFQQAAFP